MDSDQIGDDGWASVRAAWRAERWLPAGLVVALVAYALWVGLPGAALSFLAEATAGTVTVSPWTPLSTVSVVVVAVLWIVGPAALATVLVVDRVTNVNDNLRVGYRLRHPLLLLWPPGLVLAVGYAALVGTGRAGPAVSAVLVAGAVWLAVRTAAYAYRVFSLSLPVVAWLLLFATGVALASGTLVRGGLAIGREALVTDVLTGIATRTGVPALAAFHTGSYAVGGVDVPLTVAVAVAVSVGGTTVYLAAQLAWSVADRLRQPTVRRPELRTGQRYPRFARPTTASADGAGTGGRASQSAADSVVTDVESGTGSTRTAADDPSDGGTDSRTETSDDATHTRVFRPPDDADLDAVDGVPDGASDGGVVGRETRIVDRSDGDYCPECGETLEAAASRCPRCETVLDQD